MNQSDSEIYPVKQASASVTGDVTELKFILKDKVIASLSSGSVNLYECTYSRISLLKSWDKLHYFKTGELCSCTGLACFEEDVATVGEDGKLVLLTITINKPVRVIGNSYPYPSNN